MPLSESAHGALLVARDAFIEQQDYGIPDFKSVVETHTVEGTPERAAWDAHILALTDALEDDKPFPEAPGSTATAASGKKKKKSSPAAAEESEQQKRHTRIRFQRKLDLEGAPAAGEVGPGRTNKQQVGRKRDTLVDDLIIEEKEVSGKDKAITAVYCIACDHRTSHRNPARIKEHALQCPDVATIFPTLFAKLVQTNADRGNGVVPPPKVRTKQKEGIVPGNSLPAMDVDQPLPDASSSTVKEYFTPLKMTDARQALLDLALFQLVICAALPFSFVENPWLINFLLIAAPNYVTPDRSAFFIRLITEQLSAFMLALQRFLSQRVHLTLSFDGWSSRAHDEIYTFHTTLPSRRSFLTAGHVFKGVSVTAAALFDVVEKRIFSMFAAVSYSAVVGDGAANVRAGKKLISEKYIWIINIYDPCHNLNLFLKDLGKIFKAELGIISAISNFFGQSNLGTAQLAFERARQGINTGMKSASETRFGTTYIQALAVKLCMPALVTCVAAGTIIFATKATKRLIPYLTPGATHYGFLAQLDCMVKLFEAGANGITALEGQNTTCADVFYVWVTIAWHLNKLLGDLNAGLVSYRDKVIEVYNARFDQMMTESSHGIFLFAYFLHPLYFQHGGLKLVMPALKEGEKFDLEKYPELFKTFRNSARAILKGEQTRTGKKSKSDADRLTDQLVRWAVGLPPFHQRVYAVAGDSPLEYWKGLQRDSNADVLATVAIIVFSIMPSELCDERTASLLGWINAARRSSMTPEHLIATAQLSQWYKFGLTEGNYTHSAAANVKVSDVGSSSTVASTPSLLDLLNDDNVAPQDVDREALEQALFNQPDPYDLAETERVIRSSNRWAVEDFVRLDSESLKKLIAPEKKKDADVVALSQAPTAPAAATDEDWEVDD
ncbi:ribonuclease H-like domain-containing protein [Favolaschia claudopus]|uniref:Ribonuclease H-like domain-containing protein n=1 Tax=Favolaschia claudopus TaxID=2862362 RepID=A0AAW0DYM7_9AGAR